MIVKRIRKDFPILNRRINGKPMVYLDSAATSQKPRQVIEAITDHLENHNANVHRGIHTLTIEATEALDLSRKKIAKFLGVKDVGEIIFVRNASEAINLVAYSWGGMNIGKGDEIVLTIAEHHSNIVPWQQLAKENGAVLKFVPIEKGEIDLKAFEKALSKKTKLATFFHVSNILGTIAPIEKLVKFVRNKSPKAKILIDGAQAVPHMKVNLSKIGCDFYAISGHKMLGPSGVGILWGKRKILEQMPPFLFGGDMISQVKIDKAVWADLPGKFEAGTPNIEGAIGLGAAVDYLEKIGMDNIRKHEIEITKYTLQKLSEITEVEVFGSKNIKNRMGVITFRIANVPAHDTASIMDSIGVEIRSGYNCAEPLADFLGTGPLARASFYLYNDKHDVDRFIEGVGKVMKIFKVRKEISGKPRKRPDPSHRSHRATRSGLIQG